MEKINPIRIVSIVSCAFILLATSFIGVVGEEKRILNNGSNVLSSQLIPTSKENLVSIRFSDYTQLEQLLEYGFTPLVSREKDIIVSASEEQQQWLDKRGFYYTEVSDQNIPHLEKNEGDRADVFHTYTTLTTELQTIANTYPAITRLYDLGHSVQGRVLWGLKISDNPDVEENEPEVRICGCHHGNEYMSVEMPLMMAWHLVRNYSVNPTITQLINNREIWIIPLVNPDGRTSGTRENAHGIDLNRNYGYMYGTTTAFSEPETQAMRANALDNVFSLSLSFHCSGDVVNYIWNYKGQPVPDNAVVVQLSQQYGSHNGYWVVEGYDWYQTKGDTNDFSYGCRGDIDWTIEVQDNGITQCWGLNRDAMMEIITAAGMGLTGVVTDAFTGAPIAATIWVDQANWPCFTDPKIGDYHKVILPGTYTVHFRANGYQEQTRSVVVSSSPNATILNVSLYPTNDYYAYQVTQCNVIDGYSYPNNYVNNPTEVISALGPPDGVCASLGKGGVVVLDMKDKIQNYPGNTDFKIYEGGPTSDGYTVMAAQDWNGPWTSLGSGTGTKTFNLGSLQWIQYVKITDDNDGSSTEQNPGVDIDAVQNLVPQHFILNLSNFPMYPAIGPNYTQMCGPAVAQMTLNYMWWNQTQDPSGPPMTFADQQWLYTTGHANNTNTSLSYLDTQGLWKLLQTYRPLPYSTYGYNFGKEYDTNSTIMIKQICQWINYTIGTYGGHRPGYPSNVPALVPIYGDYSNWVAVRGFHSDQPAYPLPSNLTIYGFWVNDPLPGGIGANNYVTAGDWLATYYKPLQTTDIYNGKYVAICEPPEKDNNTQVTIAQSPTRFTTEKQQLITLTQNTKTSTELIAQTNQWIIQATQKGITTQLLPYDAEFSRVFKETSPDSPLFVKNLIGENYYIVPFRVSSDSEKTVVVARISADDGSFKEASWVKNPVKYLPISQQQAQQLVSKYCEQQDIDLGDLIMMTSDLIYRQASPYYPDWRVMVNGVSYIVNQQGIISIIQ